jgi:hypothetical protein
MRNEGCQALASSSVEQEPDHRLSLQTITTDASTLSRGEFLRNFAEFTGKSGNNTLKSGMAAAPWHMPFRI